jgi:uncharacterized protein
MSDTGTSTKTYGEIGWVDLTVPNAEKVRDFYAAVVGWETSPVDMGGYEDYSMCPAGTTDGVAGVCWARGVNAGFPSLWLIYITVPDAEAAAQKAVELGGEIVAQHNNSGDGKAQMVVIRDPAGAFFGLYRT